MQNAEGVPADSRWLSAPRDTTGVMTSWPRHPGRGAGKSNSERPVVARYALATGYVPARFQRAEDLNNG